MTRSAWPLALSLAVVVGLAYANSLAGGFHYDDVHSLVSNPSIRDLSQVPRYFRDPTAFSADPDKAMYRPLVVVSYAVNYALGGDRPYGYHVLNLGLHLAAVLLVWQVALALGATPAGALAAGLLFGLHPLATEPVNYVSSRSESLAAVGLLAAFRSGLAAGRGATAISWVCFAAALLAKEVAIVFPVLLFLHDRWQSGRPFRWQRHAPYWAIAAAYLLVLLATRFVAQSWAAAPRSLWDQAWTQSKAMVYYLALLAMPVHLNVEHQFRVASAPFEPAVAAALLLLGSLAWLATRLRGPAPRFWVAWSVVVLLPASAAPLNVLVNEHRLYLVLVALAVGLSLAWPALARRRGVVLGLGLALAVCAGQVWQRNQVWEDEMSLWQDAVRQSPLMPRPRLQLGNALLAAGDREGARGQYEVALRLDPDHRPARTNLANLLLEAGRRDPQGRAAELERAVSEYRHVLRLDPGYREALNNLGAALVALGRPAEAAVAYQEAVTRYPNFADGYANLGLLAAGQGDYAQAVSWSRRAVALAPTAANWGQLGDAAARAQSLEEAAAAYTQAANLAPGEPRYPYNLASVLLVLGERRQRAGARAEGRGLWEQARTQLRRALDLAPGYAQAGTLLAQVEARLQ